jgi:hypothetical protein
VANYVSLHWSRGSKTKYRDFIFHTPTFSNSRLILDAFTHHAGPGTILSISAGNANCDEPAARIGKRL